jgi:hypothetical protein
MGPGFEIRGAKRAPKLIGTAARLTETRPKLKHFTQQIQQFLIFYFIIDAIDNSLRLFNLVHFEAIS